MEVTSKSSFKEFLLKNKIIIGLVAAIAIVIIIILIILLSSSDKKNNNTSQNNQQTEETTNDTYAQFLPKQTCADEMFQGEDGLMARLNGKEYLVTGDDVNWMDQNCKGIKQGSDETIQKGLPGYTSYQCEGSGSGTYTSELMKLDDLGQIVPLGRMFDSHVTPTDHQYWQPKNRNAGYNDYKVYIPADGYITGVGRSTPGQVTTLDQAYSTNEIDYRVIIEHTCDFSTILIHIHNLAPDIMNQLTFDANNNSGLIKIKVTAGQELGTVGSNTFDVTTVDLTKKLTGFLNEETYMEGEPWKVYTQSTTDYFVEPLKSQYKAKLSRSAEPLDGKIDYDKDGFAVGNWYRQGSNGFSGPSRERYWDGHLALAYWQHNPSFIIISTGHFLDGKSAQFMVDSNSPDPAIVDASKGIVTYNLYDFYIYNNDGSLWDQSTPGKNLKLEKKSLKGKMLIQIQTDKTMKVEIVGPESTQTSFSSAAQVYER